MHCSICKAHLEFRDIHYMYDNIFCSDSCRMNANSYFHQNYKSYIHSGNKILKINNCVINLQVFPK
jgi:hypothetical protein